MDLQLKIVLKKKLPNTIFEIQRIDGSFTFCKIQQGMELHELGHWAVESFLQIQNSFFGIIAQGFNIEDFEKSRDQRPIALLPKNLPPISIFVEHYVNLLMTELNSGVNTKFFEQLIAICQSKSIEIPPEFTKEKVVAIRSLYKEQITQWENIKQGEEMILTM